MGVTLVSNIPLPATPTQTQNVLANDSKGITQSLPKPEPVEEKLPDAIPIPDKIAKTKPAPKTSATQAKGKAGTGRGSRQRSSVRPGWTGQRTLRHIQRKRRQGRLRLHRRRRGFRLALCLVRASGAAESFRKLAEVRSRPAHQHSATGVRHFRCHARRTSRERSSGAVERRTFARSIRDAGHPAH